MEEAVKKSSTIEGFVVDEFEDIDDPFAEAGLHDVEEGGLGYEYYIKDLRTAAPAESKDIDDPFAEAGLNDAEGGLGYEYYMKNLRRAAPAESEDIDDPFAEAGLHDAEEGGLGYEYYIKDLRRAARAESKDVDDPFAEAGLNDAEESEDIDDPFAEAGLHDAEEGGLGYEYYIKDLRRAARAESEHFDDPFSEASTFGFEYHMNDSLSQRGEAGRHDAEEGGVGYEYYRNDLRRSAPAGEELICHLALFIHDDNERLVARPLEVFPHVNRNMSLSRFLEKAEMLSKMFGEDDEIEHSIDVGGHVLWTKPKKRALRLLSSALCDARHMFGHADDLYSCGELRHIKHGNVDSCSDWRERMAEGKVTPCLKKEDLSKQDDQIHMRDVSKKIRLREQPDIFAPQDHETMQAEASWILNELNSSLFFSRNVAILENTEEIFNILEMLHLKKIDIPFLAMYGKEPCLSLSNGPSLGTAVTEVNMPQLKWHQLVWVVYNLDKEWVSLQRRKSRLHSCYVMLASERATTSSDHFKAKILRSLLDMLVHADSENSVDDIDTKFQFHFSTDEEDIVEKQFNKAPRRKTFYLICRKMGLADVARMFGHLDTGAGEEAVFNFYETPEDAAYPFVCKELKTPRSVLQDARHMAAVEISFEPSIRQFVRERYVDHALVKIRLTHEGWEAIPSLSYLVRINWLDQELPASELCNVQWLIIQRAEEEKLVEVAFRGPADSAQLEKDLYEKCFGHRSVGGSAQLWDEQRKLIVKDALNCYLLPSMECEVRSRLVARAKGWYFLHGNDIAVGDI